MTDYKLVVSIAKQLDKIEIRLTREFKETNIQS